MAPCRHDTTALTCVADVMNPSQAALKLSALEAAGFEVCMPWFHTLANLQHHAVALGGLPMLAHHDQAEDALSLLLRIEEADEAAHAVSGVKRSGPRSSFWRWVQALIYLQTGTGPSFNVTFLSLNPPLKLDKTAPESDS